MEIRVREWVGMKMRGREGFLRREGEAGSCGGRECEKGFQTHGGEWRKAGSIVGFFLLFFFWGKLVGWGRGEFWWWRDTWRCGPVVRLLYAFVFDGIVFGDVPTVGWVFVGRWLARYLPSWIRPIRFLLLKKKSLSSIWRFANSYWFLSPPFLKAIPNSFSLLFLFFA